MFTNTWLLCRRSNKNYVLTLPFTRTEVFQGLDTLLQGDWAIKLVLAKGK